MTTTKNDVQEQIKSKNYIIDGDSDGVIESDFFTQLKNMLNPSNCDAKCQNNGDNIDGNGNGDCDNNDEHSQNEENCCLLTKEPLQHIHIVLACGHKFNYIPIYREVIAQKTIGLSSTGYYISHTLKKNEVKCPYCRNVQDKLLPYLEYDGVKKMINVNYPTKLSMTTQPCIYSSNLHSKKSKKSSPCKENAVAFHNGIYVCKKHYEACITITTQEHLHATTDDALTPSYYKCGVILRYGKNKGKPCLNPSSCRLHKNKNETTAI